MTVEDWYERLRREHLEIEATAEAHERDAKSAMKQGKPRDAKVYATLAVSARLEALSRVIREVAPD